jgi:hypothetical protein
LIELFKDTAQLFAKDIYRMGEIEGISSTALKRAKGCKRKKGLDPSTFSYIHSGLHYGLTQSNDVFIDEKKPVQIKGMDVIKCQTKTANAVPVPA